MNSRITTTALIVLATVLSVAQAQENRKALPGNGPNGVPEASFISHRLDSDHAEGISTMDMNGDGLSDLVSGAYWYENPKKDGVLWQAHFITDSYDTEGGVFADIREKQILLNQQWPFPEEGDIVQQQDGPTPK